MAELIAKKYGMSLEDATAGQERLTALAAGVGLDYHLDATRRANTFDAHRLLHLAGASGRQDELKEALLDAYFSKGQAVGDHDVLRALATSVGLDPSDVEDVFASDRYSDHVRHDEQAATQLGVTGVPFFVFAGKYGVAGAQPPKALLEVMTRAWDERDLSDRSPAEVADTPAE
jgi:predicted DsbA family dithiol-disulfide isomerase